MLVFPDEITGTDMFCGAGGFTTGAKRACREMKMRYALNHWDRAIETHSANYPETEHILAEIDDTRPEYCGHTTFLLASPECFPAGTFILTKRGLLPIESIQVGDEVLTHRNRWRVVTAVMSQWSQTVVVKGRGHSGLELTAGHPIWTRHCRYTWSNASRRNERHLDHPEWKMAGQLNRDCFWAMPKTFGGEMLPIPPVGGRGAAFTSEFWWMVGRWLGDGNLRLRINKPRERGKPRPFRLAPAPCEVCGRPALTHRRYPHLAQFYCGKTCKSKAEAVSNDRKGSSIQICCSRREAGVLEARLNFAPPEGVRAGRGEYRWSRRDMRTATLFGVDGTRLSSSAK